MHFSRRALRKQRRQRALVVIGMITLVAMGLGLPGSQTSLSLIDRFVSNRLTRAVAAEATVATTQSAASMRRFRAEMFESRPTPTPTPEAPTAEQIPAIIEAAAAEFGLSADYLMSVARCESGLNPGAFNSAGYHGLFQFGQQTWAAYGYGPIYDPTAQARTAARLLAAGQTSRWPNCA